MSNSIKQARTRLRPHRGEPGFSLIELLVAIVIAAIVGGVIVAVIVQASKSTRNTSSSVQSEAHLTDAMTRIGRDITDASLIINASSASVEMRGIQGGHCVDTTYTAAGSNLTSKVVRTTSTVCTRASLTVASTLNSTVVTNLASTAIFTYLNGANTQIADTTTSAGVSEISRIAYTISATVSGRSNPVVLSSSSTPNTTEALSAGTGAATCPSPVLTGTLTGQTVNLSWTQPVVANGYTVMRDGSVIATITNPATTTYADTGLAFGTTHLYYVISNCFSISSPQSAGDTETLAPAGQKPTAVAVADPSNGGQLDSAKITWVAETGATSYTLYEKDTTAGGSYAVIDGPNSDLTFTYPTQIWGDQYSYYVVANNTCTDTSQPTMPNCKSVTNTPVNLTVTQAPLTTAPTLTATMNYTPTYAWNGNWVGYYGQDHTCTLSWTWPGGVVPSNVTGYYIYDNYSQTGTTTGAWNQVDTVPASQSSDVMTSQSDIYVFGPAPTYTEISDTVVQECTNDFNNGWTIYPYNSVGTGPASNVATTSQGPAPTSFGWSKDGAYGPSGTVAVGGRDVINDYYGADFEAGGSGTTKEVVSLSASDWTTGNLTLSSSSNTRPYWLTTESPATGTGYDWWFYSDISTGGGLTAYNQDFSTAFTPTATSTDANGLTNSDIAYTEGGLATPSGFVDNDEGKISTGKLLSAPEFPIAKFTDQLQCMGTNWRDVISWPSWGAGGATQMNLGPFNTANWTAFANAGVLPSVSNVITKASGVLTYTSPAYARTANGSLMANATMLTNPAGYAAVDQVSPGGVPQLGDFLYQQRASVTAACTSSSAWVNQAIPAGFVTTYVDGGPTPPSKTAITTVMGTGWSVTITATGLFTYTSSE